MFRATIFAVVFTGTPSSAGDQSLWALYLQEHRTELCGIQLTEEQEDRLDLAQVKATAEMNLTRREAGELYRGARETVRESRHELCDGTSEAELIQP